MRSLVVSIITFAALAAAAPRVPHGHRAAHGNNHIAHSNLHGDLAGRSISYDGSCGSWSGVSCPAGFCCGAKGWCGHAAEHCGAGCQADFGECGPGSSPNSSSKSSTSPQPSKPSDDNTAAPAPTSSNSQSPKPTASSQSSQSSEASTVAPVPTSSDSQPSILSDKPDEATSSTSSASELPTNAIPDKNPGEGPRPGRPSYGAPVPTLITKTFPGVPSAGGSETAVPSNTDNPNPSAEPTSSSPAQPSSPADSPPASSEPSEQPTSYGPPSSASSATPTSSSTYGGPSPSQTSGSGSGSSGETHSQGGTYIKQYTGDGSSNTGWPSESSWLSFDNLWEINQDIMQHSCSNAFSQEDNSEQELSDLKAALESVSASSGVDKAFIFAIMMQESNGCVRAPTTTYSHSNPGLFQSNQGEGSCNDGSSAQNPCPKSEMEQMVKDGVEGTASGDGLKQLLGKADGDGAQKYYRAARMYNSGSVDSSGNLGLGVATHCYCSDIANRLTGWSQGVSGCDAGSVGA